MNPGLRLYRPITTHHVGVTTRPAAEPFEGELKLVQVAQLHARQNEHPTLADQLDPPPTPICDGGKFSGCCRSLSPRRRRGGAYLPLDRGTARRRNGFAGPGPLTPVGI